MSHRAIDRVRVRVPHRQRRLAVLMATTALAAAALAPPAAHAQDATWLAAPGSGDFNTASNWTPAQVPTGTAFFGTSNVTSLSFSANTTIGGFTFNAGASDYAFSNGLGLAFNGAGIVINGGSAAITNNAGGFLSFFDTSTAGSAAITNNAGGFLRFFDTSTASSAAITNNGFLDFHDTSTAGSAAITNNRFLTFNDNSTAGNAAIVNNGFLSALIFDQTSTAGNATITTTNGGTTRFFDASSGGNARFITNAGGAVDFSGLSSSGTTAGSIEGAGSYFLGGRTLTVGGNNLSTEVSGVIQDGGFSGGIGGALIKEGTGTLTLSGANTYTGATTVNAGVLIVNGSIASSSGVAVNPGALLGGVGTLGPTAINGGTLAPGNSIGTITVQGNLTFNAGSTYQVEVAPSAADRTDVTGTAALGGTVQALFAPGSYVPRSYTILHADGGVSGAFGSLAASGVPANFAAALRYTPTEVLLDLAAALGAGERLTVNQQNVATAINDVFNGSKALPPAFQSLFGLTGSALTGALTQISGEAATGAQHASFKLTDQFLSLMLDPFVDGRGGVAGAAGPALAFVPEREALPEAAALAYGKVTKGAAPFAKAPPAPLAFERRWTAWGAGFGGRSTTNGNPASAGSHDLSARAFGYAAGLDYRAAPGTVLGFALAGGGTRWDLAQGLGGGKSDAVQVGVYAGTRAEPAYLAASAAFAQHWMSTERLAFAGERLAADFDAQVYGVRAEGGFRFGPPAAGITPYAALQVQSLHLPGYAETGASGSFALAYQGRTATATRSELGVRLDHAAAMSDAAVLMLRGRAAWAHDWVSDPTLTAAFQALPGSFFIVNGAAPATDSALVSAGGELRFANGVTLLAKFDGEFAGRSTILAGTGALRVSW
jgi:autotransporter-associated beta strand protein